MKSKVSKKSVISILESTEEQLRKAIAQAANEGDYAIVDLGLATAVAISNLRGKLTVTHAREQEEGSVRLESHEGSKRSIGAARPGYPKFRIEGDTLVRVGWSKREEKEYTHKIPKSAFGLTLKAMGRLAEMTSGPIAAEAVVDQIADSHVESIPAYQVYVVIGLLREKGVISKHGRRGYHIGPDIVAKEASLWEDIRTQGV